MKIIMLVGLPGSGKTFFGSRLGFPFYDDLTQTGGLDSIKNADTIIISDYGLIFEDIRQKAVQILSIKFTDATFYWIAWENDPMKCYLNILRRDDGRIITYDTIKFDSNRYSYPSDAEIRNVFTE